MGDGVGVSESSLGDGGDVVAVEGEDPQVLQTTKRLFLLIQSVNRCSDRGAEV